MVVNTIPKIQLLTILFILSFWAEAHAEKAPPISQTKTQIQALNLTINNLQSTLHAAKDKRTHLNKELTHTDNHIKKGMIELKDVRKSIERSEKVIQTLEIQINTLNKNLQTQQQQLANHVRASYQMGQYQPLKWLINQENSTNFSHLLTYYQYLIESRKNLIHQIDITRAELDMHNQHMLTELAKKKQLHRQLNEHQLQLEHNKQQQQTLMQTLTESIQAKNLRLEEAKRDREKLAQLLKNLTAQSYNQPSNPFSQMRKKLPFPVQVERQALQKMKQGVTFFADEGQYVQAIYPGKVVFSDWLKGYGLLLIIDHGQGFMTLYAHNQSLFKHKGEKVLQKEHIANVGHTGGILQNGLYFEVRHHGKAIPPLEWLA